MSNDDLGLTEFFIDCRVKSIREEMFSYFNTRESEEWNLAVMAALIRSAYAKGHQDAMQEPDPGVLYRVGGFNVPVRRTDSPRP